MSRRPKFTPNAEQREALCEFAKKHGAQWRAELRDMWLSGRDASQPNGHLLRQVRNQGGPSWLAKVKL